MQNIGLLERMANCRDTICVDRHTHFTLSTGRNDSSYIMFFTSGGRSENTHTQTQTHTHRHRHTHTDTHTHTHTHTHTYTHTHTHTHTHTQRHTHTKTHTSKFDSEDFDILAFTSFIAICLPLSHFLSLPLFYVCS